MRHILVKLGRSRYGKMFISIFCFALIICIAISGVLLAFFNYREAFSIYEDISYSDHVIDISASSLIRPFYGSQSMRGDMRFLLEDDRFLMEEDSLIVLKADGLDDIVFSVRPLASIPCDKIEYNMENGVMILYNDVFTLYVQCIASEEVMTDDILISESDDDLMFSVSCFKKVTESTGVAVIVLSDHSVEAIPDIKSITESARQCSGDIAVMIEGKAVDPSVYSHNIILTDDVLYLEGDDVQTSFSLYKAALDGSGFTENEDSPEGITFLTGNYKEDGFAPLLWRSDDDIIKIVTNIEDPLHDMLIVR